MKSMNFEFERVRIPSGWNESRLAMRGRLTDRKIGEYRKRGWYSEDFKAARRDMMARKEAKRAKREGNFLNDGGRLIYSPK